MPVREIVFKYLVAALIAAAVLSIPAISYSVPASPDPVEATQPDGTKFKVHIRGDEFQGWVETEGGYSVVKNPRTKKWEYGTKDKDGKLVPSGFVVEPGKGPPAGIPQHLKPKRDVEKEKRFRMMQEEIRKERR